MRIARRVQTLEYCNGFFAVCILEFWTHWRIYLHSQSSEALSDKVLRTFVMPLPQLPSNASSLLRQYIHFLLSCALARLILWPTPSNTAPSQAHSSFLPSFGCFFSFIDLLGNLCLCYMCVMRVYVQVQFRRSSSSFRPTFKVRLHRCQTRRACMSVPPRASICAAARIRRRSRASPSAAPRAHTSAPPGPRRAACHAAGPASREQG
jgi:hypothetical protein